ncbi:GntP family permease [Spirosoma taeanense]|uniref:GntP family permease n=1 Tax=Spirosoma taeanense TaxID=2735870 RepID=A0A6M5Y981_9BACT|nr:GntP family permease [Spirosoma taeanense]QJW90817.1 GntP family permease [Spirosoma taeanense]
MNPFLLLLLGIVAIIWLSSRVRLHTFVVLFGLTIAVGLLAGISSTDVLAHLRTGFGHTLEKIGLLVILGTILGALLDHSRATLSLANAILYRVGERRAPLAVIIMAFLVGLPIFCDSGFIVLSGLVLTLAQRLQRSPLQLVLCLAGGLYAVHCLVPPHPGITAAVGITGVDTGRMILLGSVLALPPTVVSYVWANFAGKRYGTQMTAPIDLPAVADSDGQPLPSAGGALAAILVPIGLISLKSIVSLTPAVYPGPVKSFVDFVGDPIVALGVGIGIALTLFQRLTKSVFNELIEEAIVKAGPVLAIVGAGGAFGEIIKNIGVETELAALTQSAEQGLLGLGLLIPFALTVVLKTAQGSSTVAVMSVASMLTPLLPALGFGSDWDRLLALAAMGAGSMTVSHANDAYFWVVARFGRVDTPTMLRTYSVMTILMGLSTFACLCLVRWLL